MYLPAQPPSRDLWVVFYFVSVLFYFLKDTKNPGSIKEILSQQIFQTYLFFMPGKESSLTQHIDSSQFLPVR